MTKEHSIDEQPLFMNIKRLLYIAVSILLLITIFQNLSVVFSEEPLGLISVFIFLFLITLGLYLFSRISVRERTALCVILAISFGLRLVFIMAIHTPIESDFKLLFSAAQNLADGDLSWLGYDYFTRWAFQIPFVLYEALLWKLFGSVLVIKLINVFFMLGTNYLIYLISKEFVSGKTALLPTLLYAVYPAPILLSSLLTNQHISLFFILLAVYLILRAKKISEAIFSGLALCVGNLMRPEGIIIIISIAVYLLMLLVKRLCFKKAKKPLYKSKITLCLIMLVSYFCCSAIAAAVFSVSGLAPNGIGNNRPEWKLVLGLNPLTSGEYSDVYEDILEIEDDELRAEETKNAISASFEKYGGSVVTFLYEKTQKMWGQNETAYWSLSHLNLEHSILPGLTVGKVQNIIMQFDKAIYICVHVLVLSGAVLLAMRRRSQGDRIDILYLTWGANYCAYLIIEIQTRYRYFIMPVMFILASIFMEHILENKSPTGGALEMEKDHE